MMPLSYIFRMCRGLYIYKPKTKISYVDDIKIFIKTETEQNTFIKNNKNTEPGYRNEMWHRKMGYVGYKNREKTEGIKKK